jgi:hypothetical protein
MTIPGVNVTTALRGTPGGPALPPSATAFLPATVPFGATDVVELTSLNDYARLLSIPAANGDLASAFAVVSSRLSYPLTAIEAGVAMVRAFFDEGGRTLYARRVVGPAAEASTLTLVDAEDDPAITITAANPGTWGDAIEVTVAAGTSSGKKVTVSDGGIGIITADVVLDNLATNAAIKAAIEGHAELGQILTVTVGAGLIVANAAAANLADGADDYAGITAEVVGDLFPVELGPGVLIGALGSLLSTDTELNAANLKALAESCEQRRRIAIGAVGTDSTPPLDSLPALFTETRDELIALVGQTRADELLSYFALFGPGVVGDSPLNPGAYSLATHPDGYVAGVRARTIAAAGSHRAPAGEVSTSRSLLGLSTAELGTVDPSVAVVGDEYVAAMPTGANALRNVAGTVRLYGWSSMSPADAWASLAVRDVLNELGAEADTEAESLVFRPIDPRGHLFAELAGILIGVAERAKARGAIFPRIAADGVTELDPGYSVNVGADVNTAETIAAGQINGVLTVRPSPTAALVNITITKVAVGAAI